MEMLDTMPRQQVTVAATLCLSAFSCTTLLTTMSQTLQRVGSSARLTLSRGSSLHGGSSGGSTHNGGNAALLLLNQAGTASSPRTLTLRAGEGATPQRRRVVRETYDQEV